MPLATGQTLSFYEVLGPLGSGGMGEVYRAKDTRLEREVAIKVLPEELAGDEDRLRRFEREAKTLASLNHPNVAGIHGVDQVGDLCFLALELVPGEDLATRLTRGPLPVAEALDVCRQIAEGLEAAHEAGVVHRDLKPANVRITPEGVVKILDFGLAKPVGPRARDEGTTAEPDSFLVTEEGLVLGTPTYMSPEQARGRAVDRRTDLWAFGCVLYECLAGRRPFEGATFPDVLAAIVGSEPDWDALPPLPLRVGELLRRALTKDPRVRLRDAGEARVQLQLAAEEPAPAALETASVAGSSASRRRIVAVAALALLFGGALGRELGPPAAPDAPSEPAKRWHVVLEEIEPGPVDADVAISPTGTHVAWVELDGIHLRPLDSLNARILTVHDLTDLEHTPRVIAWSPDGRELAFTTSEGLWRVLCEGGPPSLVLDAGDVPLVPDHLAWTAGGALVYLSRNGASEVRSVPAVGGEVTTLFEADPDENRHFDGVSALPDGSLLLLRHRKALPDPDTVALLRDGELRDVLQRPGWDLRVPRFVDDRLVFGRGNASGAETLWSVPFSLEAGEVLGEPRLIVEGGQEASLARDGTLAYVLEEGRPVVEPIWLDLMGDVEPFGRRFEAEFLWVRATADEERILLSAQGTADAVWAYDLERGVSTPVLKPEKGAVASGSLPDGRLLVADFSTLTTTAVSMDGSGEPELLTEGLLSELSPDGTFGLVGEPGGEVEIYRFDAAGGGRQLLRTDVAANGPPSISPDSSWMLYSSSRTGRQQVYVARPTPGSREWPVSSEGGDLAWFDADGDTIYYTSGEPLAGTPLEIWQVDFQGEPDVRLGAPERLFALEEAGIQLTDFHRAEGRFLGFRRVQDGKRRIVLSTGE